MKVVQACTGYPPDRIGGVETVVEHLKSELPRWGYDVRVLTRFWGKKLSANGVTQFLTLPGESLGYLSWGMMATLAVKAENPDLVHCHGLEGAVLCNFPKLVTARRIFHLHTPFTQTRFLNTPQHRMGNEILRRACFSANRVICPSSAAKEDALRHLPSMDSQKVAVLHNPVKPGPPVDSEILMKLRKRWKLEGKKVILYMGKLRPEKGIEDICKAYQLMTSREETKLMIVGAPGGAKFFKHLSDTYPNVTFTGYVDNPLQYYQLSDLYCIYSAGFESGESFAITLAQAMMIGVPVVCTDNPVFREVTGGHARFVPAHNSRELCSAFQEAFDHPGLAISRASHAKKFAEANYSIEKFMQRLAAIYREELA
jgi:glycosyltransferase involved in cell wall biosynthesis